ncbi:radical SAM protein [Actinokineospora sp. HBU206404]|uniref:Radical SAM protein n=2 Tax=Actinokineospora xionganensis TaxID=2684470 RepID=A0ABR7L4F5_9PSEU|nr:radical SAM protein [Actinokineospora xionganensis]
MTVRTGFDAHPMSAAAPGPRHGATFLWLELTGRCQLNCTHCYADSGPSKSHGAMTTSDWLLLIDDAAEIGVREIQFIGGEPTLHPALPNSSGTRRRVGSPSRFTPIWSTSATESGTRCSSTT